jgi:hypothetical protein
MTYDTWRKDLRALRKLVRLYKVGKHEQTRKDCPLCGDACGGCPYTILIEAGLLERYLDTQELAMYNCSTVEWDNPNGFGYGLPCGEAQEAARAVWLEETVIPAWITLKPKV